MDPSKYRQIAKAVLILLPIVVGQNDGQNFIKGEEGGVPGLCESTPRHVGEGLCFKCTEPKEKQVFLLHPNKSLECIKAGWSTSVMGRGHRRQAQSHTAVLVFSTVCIEHGERAPLPSSEILHWTHRRSTIQQWTATAAVLVSMLMSQSTVIKTQRLHMNVVVPVLMSL